jgi:septum site-determining protein MinC
MPIVGLEVADESILGPGAPPVLTGGRTALDEAAKLRASEATSAAPPLLIEQLLLSGRSIFHSGDVTIVGGVASGAEVVAAGSIHVYGALRGRVIAGSAGDSKARTSSSSRCSSASRRPWITTSCVN